MDHMGWRAYICLLDNLQNFFARRCKIYMLLHGTVGTDKIDVYGIV